MYSWDRKRGVMSMALGGVMGVGLCGVMWVGLGVQECKQVEVWRCGEIHCRSV